MVSIRLFIAIHFDFHHFLWLWIVYFKFGPFEWLWRSLTTYLKKQSMKKRVAKDEPEDETGDAPVPAIA